MIKFSITLCCALVLINQASAEQQDPKFKKQKQQGQTQAQVQTQQHVKARNQNVVHHQQQTQIQGKQNTLPPTQNNLGATPNYAKKGLHNKNTNKVNAHNTPLNNQGNVANANANLGKANNGKKAQLKHQNFHANPNPQIASAKFNSNYKIQNAHNWHGQKYVVFQNYHPQWHDHGWWHNHYSNVVLIGGGWYFWNAGYWAPAWGYDTNASYYPYDGPIYVGSNPRPPDQVIADVQASLQEQGFYHGEVDGLLGPLTRAALADYQQSQGLEITSAMDEPTLESLGMS